MACCCWCRICLFKSWWAKKKRLLIDSYYVNTVATNWLHSSFASWIFNLPLHQFIVKLYNTWKHPFKNILRLGGAHFKVLEHLRLQISVSYFIFQLPFSALTRLLFFFISCNQNHALKAKFAKSVCICQWAVPTETSLPGHLSALRSHRRFRHLVVCLLQR